MNGLIEERHDAIRALCQQYGVRRLDLFGSAATGAFDAVTSDAGLLGAACPWPPRHAPHERRPRYVAG
jgi:predicted nucleotidyltransferase